MSNYDVTLWNGKRAPRMGIGTWVMGGQQYAGDTPIGWANVDDATSIQTLHTAFDHGIRIIDTSNQYGGGHAEDVIAQGIAQSALPRDAFVICTKAGNVCDPETGDLVGTTDQKADITATIEGSLRRLKTDHLDLVKFHLNRHPIDQSEGVFEAFSDAYKAGKIGGFGWSNDNLEGAIAFAEMDGFVAVQHDLNLFSPADNMLRALEERDIWAFNRQPLGMGLLSGKYRIDSPKADAGDVRTSGMGWLRYFTSDGAPTAELVQAIDKVRGLLTQDGRTVAQGALGWCLSQSPKAIPLPGCRTPAQATENFGVLALPHLDDRVVHEINSVLSEYQIPTA